MTFVLISVNLFKDSRDALAFTSCINPRIPFIRIIPVMIPESKKSPITAVIIAATISIKTSGLLNCLRNITDNFSFFSSNSFFP